MVNEKFIAAGLAVTLLFVSFSLAESPLLSTSASFSTSVPPQQSIVLRNGHYEYLEVDSFSNSTLVVYTVTSEVPVSVALMNSTQLSDFQNSQSYSISDAIAEQNGTAIHQEINLLTGHYFLVFYAYDGRAIVTFGYFVYPSTPFSYGSINGPQPSGIASFGIYNDSGIVVPYEVQTNEVVGLANISSFLANNPNAPTYGDNVAGATLQLNANLVVNDNTGSQYVYWVQNTPDFVTSTNVVSLGDNLWNNTDLSGMLSNQSVTTTNTQNGGAVYVSTTQGTNQYAYLYSANNVTYNLPLSFALILNDTVQQNRGVLIQLGMRVLQNGSLIKGASTYWFDNITIHDQNVKTAYFDVSGNATTPIGSFYDSEFVFAGEGNYENTNFVNMSASLALFYLDSSSGKLNSFPSFYSFGGDTGETTGNLVVSYSNGIAQVGVGNPNYSYLGRASLTLGSDLNSIPPTLLSVSQSESSTSSSFNSTTVSRPTSTTGSNYLFLIAIAVVIIAVLAGVLLVTRRRKPEASSMPTTPSYPTYFQKQPVGAQTCPSCGTLMPAEAVFCSYCGIPLRK